MLREGSCSIIHSFGWHPCFGSHAHPFRIFQSITVVFIYSFIYFISFSFICFSYLSYIWLRSMTVLRFYPRYQSVGLPIRISVSVRSDRCQKVANRYIEQVCCKTYTCCMEHGWSRLNVNICFEKDYAVTTFLLQLL